MSATEVKNQSEVSEVLNVALSGHQLLDEPLLNKAAHFPTRSVASWGCLDCCRCIPQQSMNSLRAFMKTTG
jgi:hypothetical protein